MKSLITALAFIMLALPTGVIAQDEGKEVEGPSLGYADDPVQTVDESALMQRVEEITEVVNTHTEQIEQLDKNDSEFDGRLTKIESLLDKLAKPLASSSPVRSYGSWGTTLSRPNKLSYGSNGSSGVSRNWSSSSLLSRVSRPVVSYGSTGGTSLPGTVTSVSYGPPIVTSVTSSPPIISAPVVASYGPAPAPVQPTSPVVSSPVTTTTRRVRVPMTATTQSTTTYAPAPTTTSSRLGGRLRNVFTPAVRSCPPGATNCPY